VKFLEAISSWPEADKHTDQFELLIRHVRLVELEQWLDNQRKGLVANDNLGNTMQVGGARGWRSGGGSAGVWSIAEDSESLPQGARP